jgi:hypothetical protein
VQLPAISQIARTLVAENRVDDDRNYRIAAMTFGVAQYDIWRSAIRQTCCEVRRLTSFRTINYELAQQRSPIPCSKLDQSHKNPASSAALSFIVPDIATENNSPCPTTAIQERKRKQRLGSSSRSRTITL